MVTLARDQKGVPMKVGDLMTSEVATLQRNEMLSLAEQLMSLGRIRHLPVVQGEKVVGVVSIGDLVQKVISTQGETIQYLQEYIVGRCSV